MSDRETSDSATTSRRKGEHLRIVLEEDVLHGRGTLLDGVELIHQALPELDAEEIDLSLDLLGKRLKAPLMITSMTGGGGDQTRRMNEELARVASRAGIAFAVGSQRILLQRPELQTEFAVRAAIPEGVLLGNIGAVQLPHYSTESIARLAEVIEADGLCVHLNPAQELVQPEGDRSFRGIVECLARLVERLDGRVLVKETGAGLSPEALEQLRAVGVTAVDVAGRGGTSFTRVELHRAAPGSGRRLGEALADWGVPTAFSIIAARRILGESGTVVGSGGIQSGMDCALAIAAGASLAGLARSVLLVWQEGGEQGALGFIDQLQRELRSILLLTGCRDVHALRRAPRVFSGELRHWLEAYGWLGGRTGGGASPP